MRDKAAEFKLEGTLRLDVLSHSHSVRQVAIDEHPHCSFAIKCHVIEGLYEYAKPPHRKRSENKCHTRFCQAKGSYRFQATIL